MYLKKKTNNYASRFNEKWLLIIIRARYVLIMYFIALFTDAYLVNRENNTSIFDAASIVFALCATVYSKTSFKAIMRVFVIESFSFILYSIKRSSLFFSSLSFSFYFFFYITFIFLSFDRVLYAIVWTRGTQSHISIFVFILSLMANKVAASRFPMKETSCSFLRH